MKTKDKSKPKSKKERELQSFRRRSRVNERLMIPGSEVDEGFVIEKGIGFPEKDTEQ